MFLCVVFVNLLVLCLSEFLGRGGGSNKISKLFEKSKQYICSHYNKVKGSLAVSLYKGILIDMVLLYSVASHRSWKGL